MVAEESLKNMTKFILKAQKTRGHITPSPFFLISEFFLCGGVGVEGLDHDFEHLKY